MVELRTESYFQTLKWLIFVSSLNHTAFSSLPASLSHEFSVPGKEKAGRTEATDCLSVSILTRPLNQELGLES